MAYMKKPDELVIYDDKSQIIFHLSGYQYGDSYWDDDVWVDETIGNQIEVHYRQDEEDGWGVGGSVYVSTADIKAMADCIRSVIDGDTLMSDHSCQEDLFRIELARDKEQNTFTFTASMIGMLFSRDHRITITKSELSRYELDEYINPFFIWEKNYPVIGDNGILYRRQLLELSPLDRYEGTGDEIFVCEEPVIKTYRMQNGIGDEELWEYPDYTSGTNVIFYHALPGYWLVLQTEHYFFSIGVDGVRKYESMEELKGEGREVWNDTVTGLEEIVFPGERISMVESYERNGQNEGWFVSFSHFLLVVVRHEKDDGFEGSAYQEEVPFYGFRHVLKKCPCGADPEFRMDRHSDFYIECPECHRFTQSGYEPTIMVADWNEGKYY